MLVYKFGGVSIASAEGIRRAFDIIKSVDDQMIVVVSAMGKTTNKLEEILDLVLDKKFAKAIEKYDKVKSAHETIITDLELNTVFLEHIFVNMLEFIRDDKYSNRELEYRYDAFVSYGELLSSTILSVYLTHNEMSNKLLDMRDVIVTDSSFKEANVNLIATSQRVNRAMGLGFNIYVTQGFIAGDADGNTTTLGREGSDYSAAILANSINCDSVTIWKDVNGVYNADPKEFKNSQLISQLSYSYAVELAFSGAQVIHPKTIKPLENKNIPLYVKSFKNNENPGTVINSENTDISIPILIIKKNQNLVTIRPRDLSFVVEECMEAILDTFSKHKQKLNLIQVSGVSISISTENDRHFIEMIEDLKGRYRISFNTGLEILTIKNYTVEILERERKNHNIYIEQRTRSGIKLLREKIVKKKIKPNLN